MALVERMARMLCWKNGMNPDLTLGGDGVNFLWHEYQRDAFGVIEEFYKWANELNNFDKVITELEKTLAIKYQDDVYERYDELGY